MGVDVYVLKIALWGVKQDAKGVKELVKDLVVVTVQGFVHQLVHKLVRMDVDNSVGMSVHLIALAIVDIYAVIIVWGVVKEDVRIAVLVCLYNNYLI